jgi:DNA-binding transcriptional MerR regulator|tara:strand:+ start:105 stop:488 length:384 start_codon:yes stop_codon:yes gene_type:complete
MQEKNKNAYKTISEAAKEIGLINKKNKKINTHTLRFWEKNFKQIKPRILSGNRRYYSNKDIDFLKLIYELLKNQHFTIRGAKKILNTKNFDLDETFDESVKKKNFKDSIRKKTAKIKYILNKIKRIN